MPLFKARYDMHHLFYSVSLDRKNFLVDRHTKWYNVSSLFCLFVSSHSVVIPFIHLKCCLSTWVSAQTEWLFWGQDPSSEGPWSQEEKQEWGQPELPHQWCMHFRSKIHEAKENFKKCYWFLDLISKRRYLDQISEQKRFFPVKS